MKLEGTHKIEASRERIFQALIDPAVLQKCIPGCQELEKTGENQYRARLSAGVGSIKSVFSATVSLADLNPPSHYKLVVDGKGQPGFVKGSGDFDLEEQNGATEIRYTGEVNVGGLIASVGQRMLQGAAKSMASRFFEALESETHPKPVEPAAEAESQAKQDGKAARITGSSDRMRRVAGLIGLAGALLFFAGDMLFYGYLGSGAGFADGMIATVTHASQTRLFAGGLVGPLAACLCMIGFWHVYLNVRPSSVLTGRVMLAVFFVLMVAGSAVHTLWTAKGLALKYCYGQGLPCLDLVAAMKSYWALAYNLSAIPGYLGAGLLFLLVLFKKTWYPRWTVIVNPAVLSILSPLAAWVPSPLGAILVGGFINLSIAVFFLVSVLTTWYRRSEAQSFF